LNNFICLFRYALQFYKESAEELRERRELARRELVPVPETALEINLDDYFEAALDFPKRPPWNFDMSREELEAREHRYFTVCCTLINLPNSIYPLNSLLFVLVIGHIFHLIYSLNFTDLCFLKFKNIT
jgi:hypothetical protein